MFKHELAMGGVRPGAAGKGRELHSVPWHAKMIYGSAYAGAHTHDHTTKVSTDRGRPSPSPPPLCTPLAKPRRDVSEFVVQLIN